MNQRTKIAIRLISTHLLLIMALICASAFVKGDAFLFLSISQTTLLILYFTGYWEFVGRRFKNIFCVLMEALILLTLVWKLYCQTNSGHSQYLLIALVLLQIQLLKQLIKIIYVIYMKDKLSVEIELPFKNGAYLVSDGGNSKMSRMMNYHYYSPVHIKNNTNNSMLYATDIVKINEDRAFNFLPKRNEEYPIFNEKIYSPMDGVVVKAENDIPDNIPFADEFPYNTGNTVVIKKDDYYFLLGHMRQGSVAVKVGDVVKAGDLLGHAGNSGWTERPHVHMQLMKSDTDKYWHGTGVCIQYKNKNLYKNRLIKIYEASV
jgi:hypothetical protein